MARRSNPRTPSPSTSSPDAAVVLVSPRGVPIRVSSRKELYNLQARGYKPEGKVEPAEVEQVVTDVQSADGPADS